MAVRDDSAGEILKKFLATKRVEGTADSTLRRQIGRVSNRSLDGMPCSSVGCNSIQADLNGINANYSL